MYVKFEIIKNTLIVYLTGELDHHNSEEVRVKIDDEIDKEQINKVIMDFTDVTFMDSSGIGVIVGRLKKISARDGGMCITGVNGRLCRVLELSGLFKIIKSYGSIREALSNV